MPTARLQARANYDKLSRWYDLLAGSSEHTLRDLGLQELGIRDGEHVLEIGCGTGAALVELARAAGPTGLAVGLDLSMGMCRETQKKATNGRRNALHVLRNAYSARTRQPSVVCGDATLLTLSDGVFDAIFMSFALELFDEDDMRGVLVECKRVLRPGGRVCVVAMALPDRPTLMTRLYAWAGARFPTTVDCRPIALSRVLAAGGFSVERSARRSLWGLPVEVALARAEKSVMEGVS